MADFLLELRCEEIPARMQAKACEDLARLFTATLAEAGLKAAALTSYVTPRRLALIAHDLPDATQAVHEETKGPATSAPEQALDGFLRKTGLSKDQLEVRDVKGKDTWFAVIEKPGRASADVLAEAIPAIVRAFPWPKSMRWGDASTTTESLRWVRPLQGIIALLGETVVPVAIADIQAGRETVGHRFHSSGSIAITSAASYAEQLRAAFVIVDQAERQLLIETRANELAAEAGLVLVPDAGLVAENAGLTEWPVPLLGRFDPVFLEVPPEVIQLTLRINQKYFVLRDQLGALAPAFICTANIEAKDGGTAIVEGNGKVLTARLSDARFFWEQDKKVPLHRQAEKLERITFHEQLGSVADKVDRVAKLADWLVLDAKAPNGDHKLARQAAELSKADLVTEMVGEFPELQGLMGGYYARAEGLPADVADAIRDHYKPVGHNDDVPTAPTTVAVSLADKLDNLLSFFKIEILPTGSKDPFALRRAALGYLRLVQTNGLQLSLDTVVHAWDGHPNLGLAEKIAAFLLDRLGVQLRDEGIRHDFIEASRDWQQRIDLRVDRVEARARALAQLLDTDDGTNLLAGYKRAANILKKEDWDAHHMVSGGQTGEEDPLAGVDDPDVAEAIQVHEANAALSYTPEPAEAALIAALDMAGPRADAAIAAEDFAAAMAALATLRAPIDAFFESVTVNDADATKRVARLNMLTRIRAAVHKVADFSKIEG